MSIITTSRGTRSGGVALAELLSERLGYRVITREEIVASAEAEFGIDAGVLQQTMARRPTLLQRLRREHGRYLLFIRCALLRAVKEDNIIYQGNAGQVLLDGIGHVLRVRIEASLEQRAMTVAAQLQVGREEAIEHIREVDEVREWWIRFLYDRDWRDGTLYDLMVNLSSLGLETACDVICHVLDHDVFKATPASRAKLEDLSLEAEVLAKMAMDPQLRNQELVAHATDGVVVLRGRVRSQAHEDRAEAILGEVPGVKRHEVYLNLASEPLVREGSANLD